MGDFISLIENQQREINNYIKYLNETLLKLDATSLQLLGFDRTFDLAHILSNDMRLFVGLKIMYTVFCNIR